MNVLPPFSIAEQVSVGWGSKATQFHGSAGKNAAVASSQTQQASHIKPLDDDDLLPHLSWRTDCAFFVVSSLEELDHDLGTRRIVRTFDRSGTLTAVSDENEAGLSHAVAMKPVGNLYAVSQRFDSAEDNTTAGSYAPGRRHRHDVTFFERNGLRRGGFSLREEEGAMIDGKAGGITEAPLLDKAAKERESTPGWNRSHEIVDMKWNSDGSCLGVRLCRPQEDVLQVWMMGNWHWYLKQEIKAPLSQESPVGIQSWAWHPEQAFHLLLVTLTDGLATLESWQFSHSTVPQPLITSSSSSGVSVTDGSVERVTFFDKQTVPPPMCGQVLPMSKTAVWRSSLDLDAIAEDISGSVGGWIPRHKAWTEIELKGDSPSSKAMVSFLALLHPYKPLIQLHSFLFKTPKSLATSQYLGEVDFAASPSWNARQLGLKACTLGSAAEVKIGVALLGEEGTEASALYQEVELSFANQAEPVRRSTNGEQVETQLEQGRSVLLVDQGSTGQQAILLHHQSGEVSRVFGDRQPLVCIDEFCPSILVHRNSERRQLAHVIGLSDTNKLYSAPILEEDDGMGPQIGASSILARDANSFFVSPPFLIWTNTSHEARFLLLSVLPAENSQTISDKAGDTMSLDRRVERGGRIVTAARREMALVLQMPRGNLERVFPRGMVLDRIRTELDAGRYKAALIHCRANRVDPNLLFDHNPQAFLADVKRFIAQVHNVDHFNLFLSSIKEEDVTVTLYKPIGSTGSSSPSTSTNSKVNQICDAFIEELTSLNDVKKYINSILTAHVKKIPADYESALSLLRDLKEDEPTLVDSAIEYIIFLAPFDSLFDVALGMYDLTLALMVAQHSKKKDPREYLPFLREIRAVEPMTMQRFQIDDHLRRHGKALQWLAKSGEQQHARALEYMTRYRLFSEGLEAWSGDAEKWKTAQGLYGDYLMERQKWADAALSYQLADDLPKALQALHSGGSWQEAFTLVFSKRRPAQEIVALATSMAERLEETARHAEAGRVKLEYGRNVEGALESYAKANDITECRRICAAYNRLDLIETHVKPAALQSRETIMDDLREMTEQLEKQMNRLKELREKKEQEPELFHGENDAGLDNIDVQSDTSTQITQFTRYTKAPSHVGTLSSISATSKGTNSKNKGERKMKKKEAKKQAAGKKGSIYEEDYLYDSLQKLLGERLGQVQEEAGRLLPNLVLLGTSHRTAALTLQDSLEAFETKAEAASTTLSDVAYEAGVAADEARMSALTTSIPFNPTHGLLNLLAGNTWLDKAAQRKKMEVATKKWKSEMLETTMRGVVGEKGKVNGA